MTYAPASTHPTNRRLDTAEGRLKLVLLANATTSLAGGVIATAAAGWLADRFGLDGASATTWTRAVGVGLIIFALAVAAVAVELVGGAQRRAALVVSVADLAWVIATIVVITTAGLSAFGIVVAIVVGVAVLDFAILQTRYARRTGDRSPA